jgi:N-acyl homoserine lactone hydrolase
MSMPGFDTARRLWALEAPTFTVEAHTMMFGLTGELTIPLPAYLIEHSRGLVLFDTGLVAAAVDDPHAVYGELADVMNIRAQPHQRIDRQIEALGYKASDVTHVT